MLILVTADPLDEARARDYVTAPGNGAVLVFLGNVRDRHEGREVSRVEYDAYVPMAERELGSVAEEVARRHGIERIAVMHRIGAVEVGETSLVVAVGSPHRREAFAAGLEVIDLLKARVPIWKHELGPGGARWQDGTMPRPRPEGRD